VAGEIKSISFKRTGIGIPWIGKSDVHLTDGIATPAGYPLNIQIEIDYL